MSNTDGARPWDLDQYKPGVKRTVRAPKSEVPGQNWDESEGDGREVRAQYEPDGAPLLLIALITGFLTVMTVGLYRFWMITRLRRYYWRAVRLEGDPFEYTGRGLEKFLGFLIAIIFLVIYLGLVNLALTFVGLSFGTELALQASLFSAVPLYFFAAYRARRYIMARTRWRGIRFGMENGAWGYSFRAMGYGILAILSGGLLYPLMHFRLEKYKVDRTWFGDMPMQQNGSWLGLFGSWFWIYVIALFMGLAAWTLAEDPGKMDMTSIVIAVAIITFGYTAMQIAFLVYQVAAFRYFWDNREVNGTTFQNDIPSGSVLGIYIGGGLLIAVCLSLVGVALVAGVFSVMSATMPDQAEVLGRIFEGDYSGVSVAAVPAMAAGVFIYLTIFALGYALMQVLITERILKAQTEGMSIHNPGLLGRSRQREHDDAVEAGGFADALGVDVGAGF